MLQIVRSLQCRLCPCLLHDWPHCIKQPPTDAKGRGVLAWASAQPQSIKVAAKCVTRFHALLSCSCHPALEGRVSMPILPKGTPCCLAPKWNTLILQELASFSCSVFCKARGTSATVKSFKRSVDDQCGAADLCRGRRGGAAALPAQPGLHHQAAGDTRRVHRCAAAVLWLPCGASHPVSNFMLPP